ncbi:uncharacterized protein PgNI_02710 [Pyricularia grisea]|uniref:Uncharacterized protein n=1 Tax=Pyricularia grisea TaxID=148305 RepID=A0A6P8BCE2_PYRGI|nr:uncharacterized protein PgNI_02710 [Pyricularia grisea]TLD13434.1 hypothetical protein PgNI_02710 [Pyricularia grisea]
MVIATPPFPNRPQTDLFTGWESVKLIYYQVSNYDYFDHYLCRALQMIESARQINVKRERIYQQEQCTICRRDKRNLYRTIPGPLKTKRR